MAIRKVTIRSKTRRRRGQGARLLRAPRRNPVTKGMPRRKTDYARVVESQELPIITDATGNYSLNFAHELAGFNRGTEVAHAYKYYRCAKVELIFVPYATFAQTNGLAAARMPQLYFTIDRVNNMWQAATETEMLERGVSPKLFKRTYKFSYKPSLLQHVQLETNQPGEGGGQPLGITALNAVNSIPVFNKWLPTQQSSGWKAGGSPPGTMQVGVQVTQNAVNPYALKYYGAVAVINIEGGNNQQIGDLMCKVTWEFKSPRAIKAGNAIGPNTLEQDPYAATSAVVPAVLPNTQPSQYP